jgi:hypothetical protein
MSLVDSLNTTFNQTFFNKYNTVISQILSKLPNTTLPKTTFESQSLVISSNVINSQKNITETDKQILNVSIPSLINIIASNSVDNEGNIFNLQNTINTVNSWINNVPASRSNFGSSPDKKPCMCWVWILIIVILVLLLIYIYFKKM